jgi:hypothetical protein
MLLFSGFTAVHVLQIMCHLTTGTAEEMHALLDLNLLVHCKTLLLYPVSAEAVNAACRCVSNVCGVGSTDVVQAVLDAGLVPVLLDVMTSSVPVDEAVVRFYAVLFLLQNADLSQTAFLVNCGALPAIVNILFFGNCRELALEALRTLHALLTRRFEFQSDWEHVCEALEECGGWNRLEQLRQSEDALFLEWVEKVAECIGSVKLRVVEL